MSVGPTVIKNVATTVKAVMSWSDSNSETKYAAASSNCLYLTRVNNQFIIVTSEWQNCIVGIGCSSERDFSIYL